jgi:hypothetical protein
MVTFRQLAPAVLVGILVLAPAPTAQTAWDWGRFKLNPDDSVPSKFGILDLINKCQSQQPITVTVHTLTPLVLLWPESPPTTSTAEYPKRFTAVQFDGSQEKIGLVPVATSAITARVPGRSTQAVHIVARGRGSIDPDTKAYVQGRPTGLLGEIVVDYSETEDCDGNRRGWIITGHIEVDDDAPR